MMATAADASLGETNPIDDSVSRAEPKTGVLGADDGVMYADDEEEWMPIPTWADWFLRLGYDWPDQGKHRRLCIVSTPCDSPGAGLVALGMMRRRLEIPTANDLSSHIIALRTRLTMNSADTIVRRVNKPGRKNRWRFSHQEITGTLWVSCINDPEIRSPIIERRAFDWHIEGEPPVQVLEASPMVMSSVIPFLAKESNAILTENLARTDSAICYAGRGGGERQTRETLSAVQLKHDDDSASLASLLTIDGWHAGRVSRISYYNSRTGVLDREAAPTKVVCIDGPSALQKVVADLRFSAADIVAVVPRTADSNKLEAASQYLASLSQWYTPETSASLSMESAPLGVALIVLKKD
jgi:hypothetical protein